MYYLKNFVFVIIISQLLFSCKNSSDKSNAAGSEVDVTSECYLYVSNSDSIKMEITITGKHISGNLVYEYYEKDKNTGTIEGELQGNRFTALYSFMSEGKRSTRQVIFQKNGETFTEGYYVDGNYTIVDFPGTVVLRKVECK